MTTNEEGIMDPSVNLTSIFIVQFVSNMTFHLQTLLTQPRNHSLRAGVIVVRPLAHVYEAATKHFTQGHSLLRSQMKHLC